jgi:hypothetical protein
VEVDDHWLLGNPCIEEIGAFLELVQGLHGSKIYVVIRHGYILGELFAKVDKNPL